MSLMGLDVKVMSWKKNDKVAVDAFEIIERITERHNSCTLVCSSSQILSVLSRWSQIMKVHLDLSNGRMFTNHVSSSLESSVVGTWKQFWHQARWARPNHPKQWITTQNTRLQIHVDKSNTFSAMKHIFLFLQEQFQNELQIDFAKVKVDFERIE